MNSQTPQPSRKRIINPFSDSDSEVEGQKNIGGSAIKSPIAIGVLETPTKVNGHTRQKNPGILEKEKQMKFLLEIFPNLEAMVNINDFKYFFILKYCYFLENP